MSYTPTNVVQYNEYYPFGLQTSNSWTRDNSGNNYLYNEGSELNTTTGLYDLPFRNYDASLGRFFQVDPLAYVLHDVTAYHYATNNPIGANDPTGLLKKSIWTDEQETQAAVNVENYMSWSTDSGGEGGSWYEVTEYFSTETQYGTKDEEGNFIYDYSEYEYSSETTYLFLPDDQTQTIPTFQELWDNYPSSGNIWDAIGGKVKQNHDSNPNAFANSCTVRISRAFNEAGYDIPFMKGETMSGADNKWYYYRVKSFDSYVTNLLGAPDVTGTDKNDFIGKQGIIEFQVNGWSDASGHFTLWDGSSTALGEYWNQAYNVKLWILN